MAEKDIARHSRDHSRSVLRRRGGCQRRLTCAPDASWGDPCGEGRAGQGRSCPDCFLPAPLRKRGCSVTASQEEFWMEGGARLACPTAVGGTSSEDRVLTVKFRVKAECLGSVTERGSNSSSAGWQQCDHGHTTLVVLVGTWSLVVKHPRKVFLGPSTSAHFHMSLPPIPPTQHPPVQETPKSTKSMKVKLLVLINIRAFSQHVRNIMVRYVTYCTHSDTRIDILQNRTIVLI